MRIAAQRLERSARVLDSPQTHRSPYQQRALHVEPLRFNVPAVQPPVPAAGAVANNDPFGNHAPPAPVTFNGNQYMHLPPDLARRLAAVPPAPLPMQRRHANNPAPPQPLPVSFFKF